MGVGYAPVSTGFVPLGPIVPSIRRTEAAMSFNVARRPVRRVAARFLLFLGLAAIVSVSAGCTQESQNRIGRSIQNWTGTNGVLDIYAGPNVSMRFIEIDKLTTATATGGSDSRPYRFGYGILDLNQNYVRDPGEKRVYFEFSDYSTPYVFYENPN